MTKIILLERLRELTEAATCDLLLPVEMQEDDSQPPADRAPKVYLMDLPQLTDYERKAPYVLHQIVTGKDVYTPRSKKEAHGPETTAVVRSVFCVYHEDRQEGGLALLDLMERFRIALLEHPTIGEQFNLDLEEGLNSILYQGDMGAKPFYLGEIISAWKLPSIIRTDVLALTGGLPAQDPWCHCHDETITLKGGISHAEKES